MLTLGNKQAIVNSPDFFNITVDGSLLDIKYFGRFHSSQVIDASGQRSVPPQFCGLMFTCPSADEIGLRASQKRQPVIVRIGIVNSRNSIDHGVTPNVMSRPISFEVPAGDADTGSNIAKLLTLQFERHNESFPEGKLPFNWSYTQDRIYLVANNPDIFFNSYVSFSSSSTGAVPLQIKSDNSYPGVLANNPVGNNLVITNLTSDVITLSGIHNIVVGDRIRFFENATTLSPEFIVSEVVDTDKVKLSTPPALPPDTNSLLLVRKTASRESLSGAWVEENIALGTCENSKPYAISPSENPKILEKYTCITWSVKQLNIPGYFGSEEISGKVPGLMLGDKISYFSLYFDEKTCLDGDGPVFKLLNWLIASGANIDRFIKNNLNKSTSVADFIS